MIYFLKFRIMLQASPEISQTKQIEKLMSMQYAKYVSIFFARVNAFSNDRNEREGHPNFCLLLIYDTKTWRRDRTPMFPIGCWEIKKGGVDGRQTSC